MGFTMMVVLGILAGWLLLSVVVCVVLGFAIRQADLREAAQTPQPDVAQHRRRKRLSVA
jgi:hypothetical protein